MHRNSARSWGFETKNRIETLATIQTSERGDSIQSATSR